MTATNVRYHLVAALAAVVKFALVYPWIHSVFDSVKCKPFGTLKAFTIGCECIANYEGPTCSDCAIPAAQGTCVGVVSICKDKWYGETCAECHTIGYLTDNTTCTGDCDSAAGYYNDAATGKCLYCEDTPTCNGHGQCQSDGVCKCATGWAASMTQGMQQCGVQCPHDANDITCGGNGSCEPGGWCQCSGSWCGRDCSIPTSQNASAKPCNGNGYPQQGSDVTADRRNTRCQCKCRTDGYVGPNGVPDPHSMFLGDYCQYRCPKGRVNGKLHVCGQTVDGTTGTTELVRLAESGTDACVCNCNGKIMEKNTPCSPYCYYGAKQVNGQCACAPNARVDTQCQYCKPGYHFPQAGCYQYCEDTYTCQHGYCVVGSALKATCASCGQNRKGDIVTYNETVPLPVTLVAKKNTTLQFTAGYLSPVERRVLVLESTGLALTSMPAPTPDSCKATSATALSSMVYTLGGPEPATVKISSSATSFVYTAGMAMDLDNRVNVNCTGTAYYVEHLAYVATTAAFDAGTLEAVCRGIPSNGCVAYSVEENALYAQVCPQSGKLLTSKCGNTVTTTVVFLAPQVKLHTKVAYKATIVDQLTKGCHDCEDNYYPAPDITLRGSSTSACGTYCLSTTTCNALGTCTALGKCKCTYPHLDPASGCRKCDTGYFPAPIDTLNCGEMYDQGHCTTAEPLCAWNATALLCVRARPCDGSNVTLCADNGCRWIGNVTNGTCVEPLPCSHQCSPDLQPGEQLGGGEVFDGNACSGHGFCDALGLCVCAGPPHYKPNGWVSSGALGANCASACGRTGTVEDLPCNGHGECYNDGCLCSKGYFGSHCDVTCNATDQYIWYLQEHSVSCREGASNETVCNTLAGCTWSVDEQTCGGKVGQGEVYCTPDDPTACQLNQACISDGTPSLCTKLRCNGGSCGKDYEYQHQHYASSPSCEAVTNKAECSGGPGGCHWDPLKHNCAGVPTLATMYYQNCTTSSTMYPLLECTGLSADDYNSGGWSRSRIEAELGIFCDAQTGTTVQGDDWKLQYGLCARVSCQCDHPVDLAHHSVTAVQVVSGETGKTLPLGMQLPLAGRACGHTGCFAPASSMCGARPDPAVTAPLALLYSASTSYCNNLPAASANGTRTSKQEEELQAALNKCGLAQLQSQLALVNQACSHGQCGPEPKATTLFGTMLQPLPLGTQGQTGACNCKLTPNTGGLKNSPAVCTLANKDAPNWAHTCCNGYGTDPFASPYFGPGCGELCTCWRDDYRQGTCSFGVGTEEVVGRACTCKAGYHGDQYPANETDHDRYRLFCGYTCRNMCRGVINRTDHGTVFNPDLACPNTLAKMNTPAYQEGCYNDLLPCNGHGSCNQRGSCTSGADAAGNADCTCWGGGVSLRGLRDNIMLPTASNVALYGGPDCSAKCPGVTPALEQYFDNNYYDLHNPDKYSPASSTLPVLGLFAQQYEDTVCSGHGYCTMHSEQARSELAPFDKLPTLICECTGDYGGPLCDKQCTFESIASQNGGLWVVAGEVTHGPYQDLTSNGTAIISALSYEYGLNVCGPHMSCDNGATCKVGDCYQGGVFTSLALSGVNQHLASIVNHNRNGSGVLPAAFQPFVDQWALAFVGMSSDCAPGWYSGSSCPLGTGQTWDKAIPPLVRWQLTRKCDVQYQALSWDTKSPWCCAYTPATPTRPPPYIYEYDDKFYANSIHNPQHGGCPAGDCPNYATGRSCRTCTSDAFTSYTGTVSECTAPSASTGLNLQDEGYCTVCTKTGTGPAHLIAPYRGIQQGEWPVASGGGCQGCISNGRLSSGRLKGKTATMRNMYTCNNEIGGGGGGLGTITSDMYHGSCTGEPNTYSERGASAATGSHVSPPHQLETMLCETNNTGWNDTLQLGLCKCDSNFAGPTCAMPMSDEACQSHGTAVELPVSVFSDVYPGRYKVCQCDYGHSGFYCEYQAGSQALPDHSRPCEVIHSDGSVIECNGEAPCTRQGLCSSCANPDLDPHTMCREYKAIGVGTGIRALHQLEVLNKASGCSSALREQLTAETNGTVVCQQRFGGLDDGCPARVPPVSNSPYPNVKFYGYWHSAYCDAGTVDTCPKSCTNTDGKYTRDGYTMAGLLTLEQMNTVAKAAGIPSAFQDYTHNVAAELGIGSPPSAGYQNFLVNGKEFKYTWEQLLCKQTPSVQAVPAEYKILNIGGWGDQPPPGTPANCTSCGTQNITANPKPSPGGPIRWQRSDVAIDNATIDVITTYLGTHGYKGISFDLEGLSGASTGLASWDSWSSPTHNSSAWWLGYTMRRIQDRGYMAWLVIPAYNVEIQNGGPLYVADWGGLTLVQLMAYGRGLDSLWAGNPNGTAMNAANVTKVVKKLLQSGGAPQQIMISYSYNTGSTKTGYPLSTQTAGFLGMLNGPGKLALAGNMAWCKGNARAWNWLGSGGTGQCTPPPTPVPPTPGAPTPAPAHGSYTVKKDDTCYKISQHLCNDGDYNKNICNGVSLCLSPLVLHTVIKYDCSGTGAQC